MVSYVRKQIDDDRRLLMRELTSVRVNERAREHPLVSRIRALVPFDSIALSGIDLEGCRLGSGVYLADTSNYISLVNVTVQQCDYGLELPNIQKDADKVLAEEMIGEGQR